MTYRVLAAAIVMMLGACSGPLVDTGISPAGERWVAHDSLSARFEVTDTTRAHRLRLQLRLTEAYRYRNIYLRFRLRPPMGPDQVVTPEFVLQDVYGNWNVARTWLGHYELSAVMNDSAVFRQLGTWQLSLQAYVRSDTLTGVSQVRFEIRPR